MTRASGSRPAGRTAWWRRLWLFAAAVSLPVAAYFAYQESREVAQSLRVELIQRYSLWETDPAYRGSPRDWTRFAAWLLNNEQLLERARAKYGALADQIELDFRRDAALAFGRVALIYALAWGAPVGMLYGLGLLLERRRAPERHDLG